MEMTSTIDLSGGPEKNSGPKLTFGEVMILLSVIFGLVFQYLNFNTRMSQFEGYTRAKVESIDIELKRINQAVENHINKSKQ